MSFQQNSQGSSSYAASVLDENPSFISFIVYQMIEKIGPAALQLDGERVLRNIPPFYLLNAQPLPLQVALNILDLWVWWQGYQNLHNVLGRTIYNTGASVRELGPYDTPGASVFMSDLNPPPVSTQQATTRVRTGQRRRNRGQMPLGRSSAQNAAHAAPGRRRRQRASQRVQDDDEDKENQPPL